MCGICGIAFADPDELVDETRLARMSAALAHRGPDDAGVWLGGHIAFGTRRLSIIDLSRGQQPMRNEDGSVVLAYNGEVYNFRELRSSLEAKGHTFQTLSDTEVVLRAYEEYSDELLPHLNGMFAFAVYDKREERLLLARDRLGIKPLFYTIRDGVLAFASELDALLQSGLVKGDLNEAALDAYFTFLHIPAPDTVFKGVHKLEPGQLLTFRKGRVRKHHYWRLAFRPNPSWTLNTAAEACSDLLTDAVRLRQVSDVPLGAFLSGGMDSSSVVHTLAATSAAPVKTFCIGFDDAHANEMAYARLAAESADTEHMEHVMQPNAVELVGDLVRHFGEPFADSSAVPTWLVSQFARQDVTVALSGDGGDELFAGYTWTHMTRRVAQYRSLPVTLRHLLAGVLRIVPSSPLVGKLRRFGQDSFLDDLSVFRRRHTCFDAETRAGLYGADLAQRIGNVAEDRFQEHADMAAHLSGEDLLLYHDTVMYLPDDILTKVDRMSMANSLEVRVPFLDHRMVEFAATVPFPLKYARGTSKRVLKHALRRRMPRAVMRQRKRGFAIPIHRWFREDLRGHFEETVFGGDARCGSLLNATAIRGLYDTHLSGKDNYGHHLWALLMFEHWLRYAATVPGLSIR